MWPPSEKTHNMQLWTNETIRYLKAYIARKSGRRYYYRVVSVLAALLFYTSPF